MPEHETHTERQRDMQAYMQDGKTILSSHLTSTHYGDFLTVYFYSGFVDQTVIRASTIVYPAREPDLVGNT